MAEEEEKQGKQAVSLKSSNSTEESMLERMGRRRRKKRRWRREEIVWFAIASRITVFFLQLLFNILLPDHEADAFRIPQANEDSSNVSFYNKIILSSFAGLTRWDGQYFLHIARYGYTYEQTLAFYPLYPLTIRIVATLLTGVLPFLNEHSATVTAAFLINFICFVNSAVLLYDLTAWTLKSKPVAYKAAIFYCVNPASIFFSAVYSEALFAYLTFRVMLVSVKRSTAAAAAAGTTDSSLLFPLALSILVRYNNNGSLLRTIYQILFTGDCWKTGFALLKILLLSLAPALIWQLYSYAIFCIPRRGGGGGGGESSLPSEVIDYGVKEQFRFPGNGSADWCRATIPTPYSYVQSAYWNVGFLNYYQPKQIPNFILACPILYIMLMCITEYLFEHGRQHFYTSGLTSITDRRNNKHGPSSRRAPPLGKKYPDLPVVFIVHGLFLTLFCLLFVHIQVATRLICSASPLPYWYCALTTSVPKQHPGNSGRKRRSWTGNYLWKQILDNDYEEEEEYPDYSWKLFFLSHRKCNLAENLVLFYFLGYTVLGCAMFSNFLPWT